MPTTDRDPPPTPPPQGGPTFDPARGVARSVGAIIRGTLALLGLLLIPVGVIIAFLTPFLPIGLPIVILGVVLLARNAVWGRRWMQGVLARHPRLARFAPDWLMKLIFGESKPS